MKTLSLLAIAALTMASIGMTGCDANKGPAEKAGESLDNAVENAGEAIEEAGDKIRVNTN